MRPEFIEKGHNGLIGMGLEIFSFIIIILVCLIIYFKTQKIYSLTEHKGIKYFRKGFLYFGFGFIIRLFTFFLEPGFVADVVIDKKVAFIIAGIFAMISLSYLIASMHYKYIKEWYIYILNIIIFTFSLILREPIILGTYGIFLFLTFGISSIMKYTKSRKKMLSQVYFIYVLMFLFWIFLAFTQSISQILKIGRFYGAIIGSMFFMYLLYIVLHKLTPNKTVKKSKIN